MEIVHFSVQTVSATLFLVPSLWATMFSYEPGMPLPIIGYTPLDLCHHFTYAISVVVQSFGFYLFGTKMVAMDYFIMDLIALHASHFRYVVP